MLRVWTSHKPELALIVWTFFAWGNRVKNILDDQTQTPQLLLAGGFLLLAAVSLLMLFPEKQHSAQTLAKWPLIALAVIGSVRWLYRTPLVLISDETPAFKTVHTILALVTIVLSLWVLQHLKFRKNS